MPDTQPLDSRLDSVREVAEASIRDQGIPGWAVAVVEGGRTLWAEGLGCADLSTGQQVRAETIFALASVSKLHTAIGVAEAVGAGLLRYEDPLSKWLPDLEVDGTPAIQIHHLLAHTSGLPPLPSRYHALDLRRPSEYTGGAMDKDNEALAGPAAERFGFASCAGLIPFLNQAGVELMAAPGELHNYSNEGYVLLGAVLERASGLDFEQYMAERVIEARGLAGTAVGPAAAEAIGDVAMPHHRLGGEVRPIALWDAPAWRPPGGVHASAPDVLRFLATLDPRSVVFASHAQNLATGSSYGYGVVLSECGGVRVMQHDGGQDGVSSAFVWAPEPGIAAVALANVDGADAQGLVHAALRRLLGLQLTAPELTPESLSCTHDIDVSELAGIYSSPEGLRLEFDARGDTLALVVGDTLVPCKVLAPDRIALGNQRAAFLRRDARVWSLAVGDRIIPRCR